MALAGPEGLYNFGWEIFPEMEMAVEKVLQSTKRIAEYPDIDRIVGQCIG